MQGWLTTVDPDGTPQPTTVWFVRDRETIVLYSEPGKTKLRNISANPSAAFHINSDELGEKWVVMTGHAEVDESIPLADNPAYVEKYRGPLEHWGFPLEAVAEAYSVPVRFTPADIRLRTR